MKLDARLDPLALSVGQLDDVRIVMEDLSWAEHRIERVAAAVNNVHVRPVGVPELVAAPVELTVTLSAETAATLLRDRAPWLTADIGQDATPTLRLRRRPGLGHAEVEIHPDGSTLWFQLRAIGTRRRRWALPTGLPAYPVQLGPLPDGMQLTRIETGPGVVHLHGVLPVWRKAMPTERLNALLRQLANGATGLLDLSTWVRHPG